MKRTINIILTVVIISALALLILNKCNRKKSEELKAIEAKLYYVSYEGSDAKGKVFGCNDILVQVIKKIPIENSALEATINELLIQKDTPELHNFVQGPGLFLSKVLIANNTAEVFFNGDFDITTKCDIERIKQQLFETAKQFDEYKDINFYVGGITLERYLSIAEAGFK